MSGAYGWMVVCKSVVNRHIFEEPFYVLFEKTLYFIVIELRVNEDSPHVGFHNIRQAL